MATKTESVTKNVKTRTRDRLIKTLGRTIAFLLRLQKHGHVIGKLCRVLERADRAF